MYQPNFCAECGARVERERWRMWTSGRFCAVCDRRFRRRRFLLPLAFGALILSVGFVMGRGLRPLPAPPLVVRRVEGPPAEGVRVEPPAPRTGEAHDGEDGGDGDEGGRAQEASGAKTGASLYGPDGTEGERPTDPAEIVSICGARTKKGTPCSRRVRGTGRCWQHRGLPAMLPASRLVVPN